MPGELLIQRKVIGAVATLSNMTLSSGAEVLFQSPAVENSKLRIAPGVYFAHFTRSPRFSAEAKRDVFTWEILGVLEGKRRRVGIRIHPANFARDLLGCVAPGLDVADIDKDGVYDMTQSRKATYMFELAAKPFQELKVVVLDPVIA